VGRGLWIAEFIVGVVGTLCGAAVVALSLIGLGKN